jgi:hypothetical protein
MQQFYNWFDTLEKELGEEQDERFWYVSRKLSRATLFFWWLHSVFIENLKESRASCDSMLAEIDNSLRFLKELEKSHQLVATKTGELHQVQSLARYLAALQTDISFINRRVRVLYKSNSG